jgi:hypothetical protein
MNACPPNGTDCRIVQVIEPDSTLLVNTSQGSTDTSIDESGSVILSAGQTQVDVQFLTKKAGDDYRFEYLYIDAFGVVNPGNVAPVPVLQTIYGFSVKLAGAAILAGYILRWRVVVVTFGGGGVLDAPETIYIQLPRANTFVVHLVNARTTTDYAFGELRVENLIDPVSSQTPIWVQVVQKTKTSFTIGLSPTPPTDNYFLSVSLPVSFPVP